MSEILRLRAGALRWRAVDGEVVAVEEDTSVYLAGNRAAGLLWPLLAAGCERADLISCLTQRFGITEAQASSDVSAFLEVLRSRGLLE